MALQFYFGGSGAGKSKKLHEDITDWADREQERNFLFLVPDQFTMQTQIDLVAASKQKGIMNIDVLSFGRLSHRIFEETGFGNKPVLDDTGKSLVLRKITAQLQEMLPAIGSNLNKIGYIHEVKSALSEFMQYGIGTDQLERLTDFAVKRGALYYKLKDLKVIYKGFLDYVKEQYITTEETLSVLAKAVIKSAIIRDSVIVFDGFTGFTPIQYHLIRELLKLTNRVIVSITIDISENPMEVCGEQELFYLSKKTVRDLCRLCDEAECGRIKDMYLRPDPLPRFAQNPEMAHLERALFRYPVIPYNESCKAIHLTEALNPGEEAKQACIKIKELVLSKGFSYRDIAIVTGDLELYGDYLERESRIYEIPLFIDRTRGILLNPFIEFIRSSLKILQEQFSYQSVFHYLRTGLNNFDKEEVDRLENYVLAQGIHGKKKWQEAFTRKPDAGEEQLLFLEMLNESREKLMDQLSVWLVKKQTCGEYVKTLYEFICKAGIQEKLRAYEEMFKSNGEMEKAKEYAQIYRLVMELLEQVHSLLCNEVITLKEFADILDAGFTELEVGIIPGSVDRIIVGDVERTRLKQVKVLFFLGVNDGNIPRSSSKGGIISDIDREFLKDSGFELAPTPRQQMYIQRLYLYMNLTKPSGPLYLSYARTGGDGKSVRPSYLIDMMRRLFPNMETERFMLSSDSVSHITGEADGLPVLAGNLRKFVERGRFFGEEKETASLYELYRTSGEYSTYADKLVDAAFMQYENKPLSKAVARALYGGMLENSVSRLERYAACSYSHFLQYGLMLKERDEYGFEQVDLGNIFHQVLEHFAGKLSELNYTWFDFPEDAGDRLLKEALTACALNYGETILYSSARNEYRMERIYRILKRTVRTLKSQLQEGSFTPAHFEMSFSRVENLDAVNIALTGDEKMKLKGRIDRIDLCEDEEHVYVKVIDYKSGNKKFDLAALYYGLQLQLVVYMNVAAEAEKIKHPDKEIVPAALLYYHVDDPVVKEEGALRPEDINTRLLKELRTTGLVNSSSEVISLLDKNFTEQSLIVPVEKKKDGSFSASSSVISREDYQVISRFVSHKMKEFGKEILQGNIKTEPCEQSTGTACTFCSFKGVCGYDEKISGYHTRELKTYSEDELFIKMREELENAVE